MNGALSLFPKIFFVPLLEAPLRKNLLKWVPYQFSSFTDLNINLLAGTKQLYLCI